MKFNIFRKRKRKTLGEPYSITGRGLRAIRERTDPTLSSDAYHILIALKKHHCDMWELHKATPHLSPRAARKLVQHLLQQGLIIGTREEYEKYNKIEWQAIVVPLMLFAVVASFFFLVSRC